MKPLIDQNVKEGKDKKVVFECIFSKPNGKPKWFLKKDVYASIAFYILVMYVLKTKQKLIGN